jgi:hypothetical protein
MENAVERRVSSSDLIKSKKRVADHGEVFTPPWLVDAMLDLTEEADRIEARFLEPACGDGNFLVRVLQRKLTVVDLKGKKSIHDKRTFALIAIMSIYGIELLKDNIVECRKRLLGVFAKFLKIEPSDELYRAAERVLSLNIIHGDALKMHTNDDRPIVFAEWEYLGRDRFQRRDFRFDVLAQNGSEENAPVKIYDPMTVSEIINSKKRKMREVTL